MHTSTRTDEGIIQYVRAGKQPAYPAPIDPGVLFCETRGKVSSRDQLERRPSKSQEPSSPCTQAACLHTFTLSPGVVAIGIFASFPRGGLWLSLGPDALWCVRCAVYKKHYPPALNDEVWRLDRIGKDGAFHKRLNQAGIFTVEDFLRLVVMDPQKLRNVSLSPAMPLRVSLRFRHATPCESQFCQATPFLIQL